MCGYVVYIILYISKVKELIQYFFAHKCRLYVIDNNTIINMLGEY